MNSLPPDYHDELQSIRDFVRQTQSDPDSFSSFHWMIATDDKRRFAASSDTTDGIVNMSPLALAFPPRVVLRNIFDDVLSYPYVFAIAAQLDLAPITIADIQAQICRAAPDRLISVAASGKGLAETRHWSLNMIFAAFNDPEIFLSANRDITADTKPLAAGLLHSKRDRSEP